MDSKILTEDGWKAVVQKFKLKDKDLQKALFFYEELLDDDFEFRLKGIAKVGALAAALKRDKEVAPNSVVVKYLTDMASAAQAAQRDIARAKAEAEKAKALAAKTQLLVQKKAETDAKNRDQEEDEDEEAEADSGKKLMNALKALRMAQQPYFFLVCDVKPYGLIISKKDIRKSAQARKELSQMAGGSTRPPKFGECHCDAGKYVFEMDKPPSGLARILQKWVKETTGLGIKVMVGTESADDEEAAPGAGGAAGAAAASAGPAAADAGEGTGKADDAAGAAKGVGAAGGAKGFAISASVGRGGKNKPDDVTAVQTALNTRAKAALTVDGKCGPKTITAIMDFQKTLGQFTPDGLVEVNRATARGLAGAIKPGPAAAPPQPVAAPKLGKPALAKAPEEWQSLRKFVGDTVEQVVKAVNGHYAHEHPDLVKEIQENLKKLNGITDGLDQRIVDSLKKANAAANDAAKKAELKNAKNILAGYINYVKSEPLIAHVDANPWVKTDLKKTLTDHLTQMAQAIA